MTTSGDDRAERLRRLSEQRAARSAAPRSPATGAVPDPAAEQTVTATRGPAAEPVTPRAARASAPAGRRKHAAAAARVLAAGLSGTGFLFGVAALAAKPVTWSEPSANASGGVPDPAPQPEPAPVAPVTPVTVVIVERRHRPVYVDEQGNPVDPAALSIAPAQPSARPAPAGSTAPVARPTTSGATPPRQTGTAAPAARPAPATTVSPAAGTSPATPGTPVAAVPTTQTTTNAVTPTTVTTVPPPPPPPRCSGSKCP